MSVVIRMRLRNVPHAKRIIARHPDKIVSLAGDEDIVLNDRFPEEKPLEMEIGAGKGRFIHTLAKANPSCNHLAVEKFDNVIIRALERVVEDPLLNLLLVRADAENLKNFLRPRSVKRIYLNFSDPWPKKRHEKRRLTHPDFLAMYKEILKPGGRIEFKTDNRKFFEYSLKTMNRAGMRFLFLSLDLHSEERLDNIMTEFEERYGKDGPIYIITASFEEDHNEENVQGTA